MNKILVIGDVIEDLIVIPEETIRPNTDTKAQIQKSMGGQAANVAAWVSHKGAAVSFVGCVGSAYVGKLEQDLKSQGIHSQLQTSNKPTGSLVVLVDGQTRSMLTDRGANQDLDLAKIDPTGFGVVYVSGYSLLGRSFEQVSLFAGENFWSSAHNRYRLGSSLSTRPKGTCYRLRGELLKAWLLNELS